MRKLSFVLAGFLLLAINEAGLRAQPAAPAVPAVPAVPAAAPAAPRTLWSFLGLSKANLANCKAKFCQSQLGQLINNGTKPLTLFSGGIIPSCCPTTPTPADLAKQGAEGAAAKIQKEEAEAKARRAAVRYLGTVDCRRFPEAEKALMDALRTDPNECVRFEAAMALGSGCCCTKKIIDKLTLTVTGSDKDGNPAENSPRVKAAAQAALEHCLACYKEPIPPTSTQPERPEKPPESLPEPTPLTPAISAAASARVPTGALGQTIAEGRKALAAAKNPPQGDVVIPTGKRNLFDLWVNAQNTNASSGSRDFSQSGGSKIRPVMQSPQGLEPPLSPPSGNGVIPISTQP